MIYKIKKGSHRCWPIKFGLSWKNSFTWNVMFNDSCKYEIGTADQEDINKLCGRGFFSGDSARFGWRWLQGKLELMTYVHDKGIVKYSKICDLEIGQEYRLHLLISDRYTFQAGNTYKAEVKSHNKKLSFPMNFYFGGNQVARHDITIKIC